MMTWPKRKVQLGNPELQGVKVVEGWGRGGEPVTKRKKRNKRKEKGREMIRKRKSVTFEKAANSTHKPLLMTPSFEQSILL